MTKVLLSIDGQNVVAEAGSTLSSIFKANDVAVVQFCGGQGICASCHFVVVDGSKALSAPTEQEQMMLAKTGRSGSGARFACQTQVIGQGAQVLTAPAKR
jgi:ferredoxin